MATFTVYALYDERAPEDIRYVGFSDDPVRRFEEHLGDARSQKRNYKVNWIRKVLAEGARLAWKTLFVYEDELEASAAEIVLIADYRARGHKITNGTLGGERLWGIRLTPETRAEWLAIMTSPDYRAKMSAAMKGKPKTPEHAAKVRAAITGRIKSAIECANIKAAKSGFGKTILSVAARAKISDKLKGRPKSLEHAAKLRSVLQSPERRAKMSASGKSRVGEKRSPAACAKISAATKGRVISVEQRAKNSAKHTGMKRSAESRANIADGQRRRFESRWETMAYIMAIA